MATLTKSNSADGSEKRDYLILHLSNGRNISVGDDSQIIFGDELELLDTSRIKCYPINDLPEKIVPDNLAIDQTGKYFCLKGRKIKEKTKSEKNEEDKEESIKEMEAERMTFVENIPLFLANADKILSDSRMFLAPVPIQNGLAYTGTSGFGHPTLGIYLEWWKYIDASRCLRGKEEEGLIWYFGGSPLSGSNSCRVYTESDHQKRVSVWNFIDVWPSFMFINRRYTEAKQLFEAYSLDKVLSLLSKKRQDQERQHLIFCNNLLSAKSSIAQRRADEKNAMLQKVEEQLLFYACDVHRDEILEFWKVYSEMKTEINRHEEEFSQFGIKARAKVKAGLFTKREFKYMLKVQRGKINDDVNKLNTDCDRFFKDFENKYFSNYPNHLTPYDIRKYILHIGGNV